MMYQFMLFVIYLAFLLFLEVLPQMMKRLLVTLMTLRHLTACHPLQRLALLLLMGGVNITNHLLKQKRHRRIGQTQTDKQQSKQIDSSVTGKRLCK